MKKIPEFTLKKKKTENYKNPRQTKCENKVKTKHEMDATGTSCTKKIKVMCII